jgi:hypothetical protein
LFTSITWELVKNVTIVNRITVKSTIGHKEGKYTCGRSEVKRKTGSATGIRRRMILAGDR